MTNFFSSAHLPKSDWEIPKNEAERNRRRKKLDDDDDEKCFASQHFFDCVLFTVGRFVILAVVWCGVLVSGTFGLSHPLNWSFGSIIFDAESFCTAFERFW